MDKIIVDQESWASGLWFVGWLFTIGFLKLTFWRGVWAVIVWPYYVGVWVRARLHHES